MKRESSRQVALKYLVPMCSKRTPEQSIINNIMRDYRKRAKKKGIVFDFTEEEVKRYILRPCFYCGAFPSNESVFTSKRDNKRHVLRYNGLDRVDNLKGYTKDNVVTACRQCNLAKRTLTLEEFTQWAVRLSARISSMSAPDANLFS